MCVAAPLVASQEPVAAPVTVVESFSTTCHTDGSTFGLWRFVYDGLGCNGLHRLGDNTVLVERPRAAVSPDESHAGLTVGPSIAGDFALEVSLATVSQLRRGSAPNPWEVGWVIWHYTDDTSFYYFIPKPNGWELGKADPGYPGSQRFLATGSTPTFPVGPWYRVGIRQTGQTIDVLIDDLPIVTFTDVERPYVSGRVGFYTEDAEIYFDDVAITMAADSASQPGR